ncbi:MAG: hypothetical protein V1896_02555 [Candidatus Zambryskibacteria bacterium]
MTTETTTAAVTEIPTMNILTCALCGWEYLKPEQAKVPALSVLTDDGAIELEDIVLENHAYCRRCVKRVSAGCPEAEFHSLGATKGLVSRLLDRKAARKAAIAEYEAEKEAEAEKFRQMQRGVAACVTARPLLSVVEIKTSDKNGYRLMGAAAHTQVHKALKQLGTPDVKAERRARREKEKAMRALKAMRNAKRTEAILQQAS